MDKLIDSLLIIMTSKIPRWHMLAMAIIDFLNVILGCFLTQKKKLFWIPIIMMIICFVLIIFVYVNFDNTIAFDIELKEWATF